MVRRAGRGGPPTVGVAAVKRPVPVVFDNPGLVHDNQRALLDCNSPHGLPSLNRLAHAECLKKAQHQMPAYSVKETGRSVKPLPHGSLGSLPRAGTR